MGAALSCWREPAFRKKRTLPTDKYREGFGIGGVILTDSFCCKSRIANRVTEGQHLKKVKFETQVLSCSLNCEGKQKIDTSRRTVKRK